MSEFATTAAGLLCPTCRVDLLMSNRQGIEIDYCPKCRGVWLDRGELDKIIERSVPESSSAQAPNSTQRVEPNQSFRSQGDHYRSDRHGGNDGHASYGRRKESFLSRLFDD
jgi:Zn-finger nucleic acid-binding protein